MRSKSTNFTCLVQFTWVILIKQEFASLIQIIMGEFNYVLGCVGILGKFSYEATRAEAFANRDMCKWD